MSTENANQPAFPVVADFGKDDKQCSEGLTKRELIAAMAMQGMCANNEYAEKHSNGANQIASKSTEIADALLIALEKTKS